MKPVEIDAFDFARLKEQRDGEVAVAQLSRLAKECVDNSGTLRWVLSGATHDSGHPQLSVDVTGDVQLMCQRCLSPFAYTIDSESILILAQDEPQADQVEAMLGDDSLDVIVGSKVMSVIDLVEDEALLAIPQAPKHAQCPGQPMTGIDQEIELEMKPSPFAVLKNLKH